MLNEDFATGDTTMHRLDPRLRVIFATVFSFAIALTHQFPVMLTGFALTVLWVGISRLDIRRVFQRLAVINLFNLILWLVLPFTYGGDGPYAMGPLTVYRSGVILATQITIKSNTILLAFIALIATMPLATLGHALAKLRVPDKMIYLLLLSYRYVFVIEREYRRLVNAAKMRCFKPGTSLHTYRTYAYLFGMLLVRASARAERVYHAMLCRGFNGKFYSLQRFSLSRIDKVWMVIMALTILVLEIIEWVGIPPYWR